MKVKRDTITGLVGLTWSVIWFILIQVQTTQPANLLEPGPRLFLMWVLSLYFSAP